MLKNLTKFSLLITTLSIQLSSNVFSSSFNPGDDPSRQSQNTRGKKIETKNTYILQPNLNVSQPINTDHDPRYQSQNTKQKKSSDYYDPEADPLAPENRPEVRYAPEKPQNTNYNKGAYKNNMKGEDW